MTATLYIAAKAPRPGLVKTRLGRAIGHEAAAALYRAFLRDLAASFARAPFAVGWYVTPPDAWSELRPLVGAAHRRAPVLAQGAGDWTARQEALFRGAAARGEGRTILIASDSPHLTVAAVAGAFRLLDRHDLVLGPVHDGGYYLIGMRGYRDVLRGMPMSTDTVLRQLVARARDQGLRVGLSAPTFDIDEPGDLNHLRRLLPSRPDLAATRAALRTLGLDHPARHPPPAQPDPARPGLPSSAVPPAAPE